MANRKHWAVLFLGPSLERTDAIYHEWGAPGVTVCKRRWHIVPGILGGKRATWVERSNAEKFARQCKRCAP